MQSQDFRTIDKVDGKIEIFYTEGNSPMQMRTIPERRERPSDKPGKPDLSGHINSHIASAVIKPSADSVNQIPKS
ncbi:MAG: hypothetical protein R2744_11655 [Bacteroidales bacterium]